MNQIQNNKKGSVRMATVRATRRSFSLLAFTSTCRILVENRNLKKKKEDARAW
jgi:hypothetical protein